MRFRRASKASEDNESYVTIPVYGPDPIGSRMVHSLDGMHSLTYGYQHNYPPPAWKPQGERERSSSWDLGPLQRWEGLVSIDRSLLRQEHLQALGKGQPTLQSEIQTLMESAAGLRLGVPGRVFIPGSAYPVRNF